MAFLEELQKQPPYKKKIIIWAVLIVLGALMLLLWGINFRKKITSFQKEDFSNDFNVSDLKAKMDRASSFEIPGIDEESAKKLEEEMNNDIKKLEQEQNQQNGPQL